MLKEVSTTSYTNKLEKASAEDYFGIALENRIPLGSKAIGRQEKYVNKVLKKHLEQQPEGSAKDALVAVWEALPACDYELYVLELSVYILQQYQQLSEKN